MEQEFVSCDVHQGTPSVRLVVTELGVPKFECELCVKEEVEDYEKVL